MATASATVLRETSLYVVQTQLQAGKLTCRTAFVKKYTEDHEWIELDSDGKTGNHPPHSTTSLEAAKLTVPQGTIGITEYASKALGDVVYVELPEVGMEVTKGDTIGAVESVKSASDIMTPVSGVIADHNKLLEEKPGTINKSPESEGWLAKIEVSDLNELDALMSKEDYDKFEKE
jgi:glycine cleavage system H protein